MTVKEAIAAGELGRPFYKPSYEGQITFPQATSRRHFSRDFAACFLLNVLARHASLRRYLTH